MAGVENDKQLEKDKSKHKVKAESIQINTDISALGSCIERILTIQSATDNITRSKDPYLGANSNDLTKIMIPYLVGIECKITALLCIFTEEHLFKLSPIRRY